MSDYRVEWADNPLESRIYLTDAGRLRLRLGVALDLLLEIRAWMSLAKRDSDMKWLDHIDCGDDVQKEVEKRAADAEEWLQENHCGDCTCVPASCVKCRAESLLGFSVTEGLGKHEGHEVQSAFSGGRITIDQAIDHLENSPMKPTWGTPAEWAPHWERWRTEKANAAAWLRNYRATVMGEATTKAGGQ